jgi:hypothetical protein
MYWPELYEAWSIPSVSSDKVRWWKTKLERNPRIVIDWGTEGKEKTWVELEAIFARSMLGRELEKQRAVANEVSTWCGLDDGKARWREITVMSKERKSEHRLLTAFRASASRAINGPRFGADRIR